MREQPKVQITQPEQNGNEPWANTKPRDPIIRPGSRLPRETSPETKARRGEFLRKLNIERGYENRAWKEPEELVNDCLDYLAWCEDNPLEYPKTTYYRGQAFQTTEKRKRAPTVQGFCRYCMASMQSLYKLKKREEEGEEAGWLDALFLVKSLIKADHIENALVDGYNANLVSRIHRIQDSVGFTLEDLGEDNTAANGAPPVAFNITPIKSGTFMPPDKGATPATNQPIEDAEIVEATPAWSSQKEG